MYASFYFAGPLDFSLMADVSPPPAYSQQDCVRPYGMTVTMTLTEPFEVHAPYLAPLSYIAILLVSIPEILLRRTSIPCERLPEVSKRLCSVFYLINIP